MAKYLLFLLFAGSFAHSASQQVPKPPPIFPDTLLGNPGDDVEFRDQNCIHIDKYSLMQRRKFYPFNNATTIKLLSFVTKIDPNNPDTIIRDFLPIKNDTICYNEIKESVSLTTANKDSLTDILYNIGYSG